MKQLFIIRGAPGSGKTTFAHKITPWVCEADDYFTNRGTGEYKFNKDKIKEAHTYCQFSVNTLMSLGHTPIAVSNTSIRRWETKAYKLLAEKYGYEVTEIKMLGKFDSEHNVPFETIERMKREWED